ncbi:MAG: EAL domain-containing protein [Lachnospiraceae bacterium]|nr:EAL domain-containing protein [Lachnospiraceae bacterium]
MDALYYQVDLLKTLNDKLTNRDRINQKFLNISGHAYYYYNYTEEYFESVGDWKELVGMPVERFTDTELLFECVRNEDQSLIREVLEADLNNLHEITREFCLKNNKVWLDGSAYITYGENGEALEKYVCFRNITKFKQQNDELTYMAYYDSLTGLNNRNYFVKQLRDMIEKAEEHGTSVSVAMVDIDDFKKINDSIGLILGDELIQDFGQYLGEFQNKSTIIGRFGADVFIVAIYDPCGSNTMEQLYRSIKNRIRRPFVLSNRDEIYISVSTGVAEYPDAGESSFVIIKNAEICMFKAKEEVRGGIKYFDHDILEEFLKNVSMEKRLRSAIENECFELYFQPQFDCKTGKLRGAEALIRWQDKDGSFISPAEFIPLAEKSGGIIPIGNWVLKEAIMTYASWKRQFSFDGIMSINISAIQLRKDNFSSLVMSLLNQFNVQATDIEIEITESIFIENFEEVIEKMNLLRANGIRVSLDDFGTGFSSLSYLKDLPIDTLKIDRAFVDTAISDSSTGIITESVVNMVKKLGLETVAEGVETQEQFEFLKKIDCDNIQGFLLGKPMSREDFEILLIRKG